MPPPPGITPRRRISSDRNDAELFVLFYPLCQSAAPVSIKSLAPSLARAVDRPAEPFPSARFERTTTTKTKTASTTFLSVDAPLFAFRTNECTIPTRRMRISHARATSSVERRDARANRRRERRAGGRRFATATATATEPKPRDGVARRRLPSDASHSRTNRWWVGRCGAGWVVRAFRLLILFTHTPIPITETFFVCFSEARFVRTPNYFVESRPVDYPTPPRTGFLSQKKITRRSIRGSIDRCADRRSGFSRFDDASVNLENTRSAIVGWFSELRSPRGCERQRMTKNAVVG